jgi:HD-GYP domain-containing protein (c-di-GMP phosphodiesterase class II)
MENESTSDKPSLIKEVKSKIRLLNAIAAFIIITLLAVILRYLYQPVSEAMDFLPDLSISLILVIIIVLTILGFYMWRAVSKQIISNIERYRDRLDQILTITRDLREEIYGDILLGKIMDYSLSMTQSDAGAILLMEKNNLVFKVIRGDKADSLMNKSMPRGKGIAGWVAENGKILRITDAANDKRFNAEVDAVTGDQARSILCVPLIMKTGVVGVIELLKKQGFYSAKDEEIISYLADHAAISIDRARFFEDQKNYEIHVTDILLDAIDSQIPEKAGHAKRVAEFSNIIARAVNMSEDRRKKLYFACLLHDVGFLKIKSEDIFRPDGFKQHPVIGYEMIKPINFYADIAPFILYHHERYDGLGYPAGLTGEEIPLESRIIAIAEAFDSMVSSTSYKIPVDFNSAIKELNRNAGTQFDFWLVEVFVSNVKPEIL